MPNQLKHIEAYRYLIIRVTPFYIDKAGSFHHALTLLALCQWQYRALSAYSIMPFSIAASPKYSTSNISLRNRRSSSSPSFDYRSAPVINIITPSHAIRQIDFMHFFCDDISLSSTIISPIQLPMAYARKQNRLNSVPSYSAFDEPHGNANT